jgi:hypothetical protein
LKVKIIDDGKELTIDAGSVVVGSITLLDLVKRFIKLENDYKRLNEHFTKREQTLKEVIKKL